MMNDTCPICKQRFEDGITVWINRNGEAIHPHCVDYRTDYNDPVVPTSPPTSFKNVIIQDAER